jgi:hypothetical protein
MLALEEVTAALREIAHAAQDVGLPEGWAKADVLDEAIAYHLAETSFAGVDRRHRPQCHELHERCLTWRESLRSAKTRPLPTLQQATRADAIAIQRCCEALLEAFGATVAPASPPTAVAA